MPVIYQSGGSSSSSSGIPEVYTDPVSPTPGQTWILATAIANVGQPIGLLLSLTYAVNRYTYQLSYYTSENLIIRTVLS